MYSYEIVFSYPDLSFGSIEKQTKKNALQYKQTSEYIVAEKDEDVLSYVSERCKIPDHEFVACIRRNPIIKIMQSAVLQQPTNASAEICSIDICSYCQHKGHEICSPHICIDSGYCDFSGRNLRTC